LSTKAFFIKFALKCINFDYFQPLDTT
jgi:hypothetical protein